MAALLYSIIETPTHPALSPLYRRLGIEERRLNSQRNAIAALKREPPDFIVAEFIYGFSTYYQATNISNLDVLLSSLVKYSPQTRVIVLVKREERPQAERLAALFPLHAILEMPVSEPALEAALCEGLEAPSASG